MVCLVQWYVFPLLKYLNVKSDSTRTSFGTVSMKTNWWIGNTKLYSRCPARQTKLRVTSFLEMTITIRMFLSTSSASGMEDRAISLVYPNCCVPLSWLTSVSYVDWKCFLESSNRTATFFQFHSSLWLIPIRTSTKVAVELTIPNALGYFLYSSLKSEAVPLYSTGTETLYAFWNMLTTNMESSEHVGPTIPSGPFRVTSSSLKLLTMLTAVFEALSQPESCNKTLR